MAKKVTLWPFLRYTLEKVKEIDPNDIQDILRRAKEGDSEAFGLLYTQYYTPVYRYVYFRAKAWGEETAEDITQEIFIKAYNSFGSYSYSGKSPLAYLYTIARNILIDKGRKKKLKMERLDLEDSTIEDVPDDSENRLQERMRNETEQELHSSIAQLSPDQKDVIILRFIDGLPTNEIADILKRSEVAIRQLQSKGLKALRKIIHSHE